MEHTNNSVSNDHENKINLKIQNFSEFILTNS